MPTLSQYVTQVQRLLHDPTGTLYPVSDVKAYINETRSRLSLQSECVRVLYGQQFSTTNNTVVNQEVYPYPTAIAVSSGIKDVIQVKSVTVNWGGANGSNQYMLEQWSFTKYQAYLGFYGPNLQGNPAVWCNYQNAVRMRPIPSQISPMQWDTICSVIDLASDSDPEAIPYPYTDSVKYYAAYLSYMNSQNPAPSTQMEALYNKTLAEARSFTQRTFVPYVYR